MNPPEFEPPRTLEQPDLPVGPPPASTRHNLFFGPEGLRAVWGVILFVVLWLAFTLVAAFVIQFVRHAPLSFSGGIISPASAYTSEGAAVFGAALATWIMAIIERRPVSIYGFATGSAKRNLAIGLISGLVMLSTLVVLLRACGLVVFDAKLLSGSALIGYALIWAGGFSLTSIAEELACRGYLQFTLTRGLAALYRRFFGPRHANALGFWSAAFVLSFAFGITHSTNPGESPLGLLSAGLAGLLFCFSLWRTGSLWWALGFHATWDWAQSFLYGVPDSGILVQGRLFSTHALGAPWLSGGVTGPEGSILFLLVAFLAAVAVVFTLPRSHRGYLPLTDADVALSPSPPPVLP